MAVELYCLCVGLFWVCKQILLDIFATGGSHDCLCRYALVDVECDGIDFDETAVVLFPFTGPFDPRLMGFQCCGDLMLLVCREYSTRGFAN